MPRVVSVNVCTDQLVLLLAEPEQIVSLSPLSVDPRTSVMAQEAVNYSTNNAQSETIAMQNPDVVVAGAFNDPAFLRMLESISIKVETFPITSALSDIPDEIRKMGQVLNQSDKAEAIAAQFETDLARLPPPAEDAPLAAFFLPNGFSLGAGTLSHDILVAGGARNLSVELGIQGNGTVSLEQVILHQPDLLIGAQPFGGFSQSEEMATHPALAAFPVLHSSVAWVCGVPSVLDAVSQVSEKVDALDALPDN
ncbi:ABC transporter substrate-binding protein [Marivita sp.]|uniref:ABC transporter substrate-binding protein n=1 Tax=Marivita sp. TaxID=2003365 RepID=UPI0025BC0C3A|nr:ABC transporter substrate-binding protein [Marivita sp.]